MIEDSEKFTDPIDQGSHLADVLNETAIEVHRHKMRPEQVQNEDGTWPEVECRDCGEDLGQRAAMGRVRCVPCQEFIEQRGKFFAT